MFYRIATHSSTLILTALMVIGLGTRVSAVVPREIDGIDVKNKLGSQLDTGMTFRDAEGKTVTLGDYLDGEKPVLLTLNFYTCNSLCSVQLNKLNEALAKIKWSPGAEDFRMVTISFDAADTVEAAKEKQIAYRRALAMLIAEERGKPITKEEALDRIADIDWDFLIAGEEEIERLLDETGYVVKYDKRSKQYAHSPVTYVIDPKGVINRYLWGLEVNPRDLKFGLMESSNGTLGGFGEKIILSCFAFSGDEGGYTAAAWNIARLFLGTLAAILVAFLLIFWVRDRHKDQSARSDATSES